MMLLYNENNQRRYLDIPDSTIFQSPDIQSAYQDYLRSCNLLKEKTQSNTNQVAYDVFFEKNKAWILQEFSGRVVPV